MLRMIWFSICWIWCIPRCLKLIKLISENLSNKPTTGQPSNLIIDIDLKLFGKLRLWVFGQKWFESLLRKFPCLGLLTFLSLIMEDVMIRWANDDAPVPTSSELFFKILTPSHSSPCVQITTAAPTLRRRSKRAGCSSIHKELSRRQRKGAAVAPRVELFPSLLSVLSHTCWLSIRWMSQRTERILWFDVTMDPRDMLYHMCYCISWNLHAPIV